MTELEPNNDNTQWKSTLIEAWPEIFEFMATTANEPWKTLHLAPGLHVRVYATGWIQWLDYGKAGPRGPMFIKTSKGYLNTCKTNNAEGYRKISIDGQWYLIHRLVALAWLDNPEGKSQVDHINGDRGHNHIVNLRWATPTENAANRHVGMYPTGKIVKEEQQEERRV